MLDRFEALAATRSSFARIFDVVPGFLDAGLDAMEATFGGIEAYFAQGLGVDAETQRALRAAFLSRD